MVFRNWHVSCKKGGEPKCFAHEGRQMTAKQNVKLIGEVKWPFQ